MAENAPPVNLSVSRCQLPNRKYEDCNPDNLVEKNWRLVAQEWWWAPPYFWKPSSPSRGLRDPQCPTIWHQDLCVPLLNLKVIASLLLRLFSSPFSRWRLQFGPHLDQCQHPVLHLDLQFGPHLDQWASSASSTPSTPGPMPAPSGVMAKHQTVRTRPKVCQCCLSKGKMSVLLNVGNSIGKTRKEKRRRDRRDRERQNEEWKRVQGLTAVSVFFSRGAWLEASLLALSKKHGWTDAVISFHIVKSMEWAM